MSSWIWPIFPADLKQPSAVILKLALCSREQQKYHILIYACGNLKGNFAFQFACLCPYNKITQ